MQRPAVNPVIAARFDAWPRPQRLARGRRLAAALGALFGPGLALPEAPPADWPGLQARLAAALEAYRGPRTFVLAELGGAGEQPAVQLVADVAEILFVPRRQRSHYAGHREPWAPWDMRRLLLEYALAAEGLERLQDALTKPFCATACSRLPVGCCSVQGYDMGVVPERMLALQQIEALAAGWKPPLIEIDCRYHTDRGCALRLFKSPACCGTLCDELVTWLRRSRPAALVEPWLAAMARFRNCPLGRQRIFDLMAEAQHCGGHLLAAGAESCGPP
jgi:hypothetical protein